MSKKIIVDNPNNLQTIDYHKLKILQGDLKTLSKENLTKLCNNSIKRYGYFVPAFIWRSDNDLWILDATQRYHALEQLEKEGYEIPEIPYIEIEAKDKKDAAEKLLQITSRYGTVNPETTFFEDFNIDLSFINDIEIPELDIKLEELAPEIVEDEVPKPPTEPLSKTGDLWLCGKHRILCGDATKEADIVKLMDGKKIDLLLTDPPYGINIVSKDKVGISGKVSFAKKGSYNCLANARSYTIIKGDDQPFDPIFLMNLAPRIILWRANNYASKLPDNAHWIVWDKKCERGADHNNFSDVELAWTNIEKKSCVIYRYLWSGLLREGKRDIELSERVHPTQKPVGLFGDILNDYSKENNIIADFFLGSGTTLIASHQTGRICYGCEISEAYCDVILDRYAKFTGDDPIRESDGVKWSELKKEKEEKE